VLMIPVEQSLCWVVLTFSKLRTRVLLKILSLHLLIRVILNVYLRPLIALNAVVVEVVKGWEQTTMTLSNICYIQQPTIPFFSLQTKGRFIVREDLKYPNLVEQLRDYQL